MLRLEEVAAHSCNSRLVARAGWLEEGDLAALCNMFSKQP